jgi:hypothetical protein
MSDEVSAGQLGQGSISIQLAIPWRPLFEQSKSCLFSSTCAKTDDSVNAHAPKNVVTPLPFDRDPGPLQYGINFISS